MFFLSETGCFSIAFIDVLDKASAFGPNHLAHPSVGCKINSLYTCKCMFGEVRLTLTYVYCILKFCKVNFQFETYSFYRYASDSFIQQERSEEKLSQVLVLTQPLSLSSSSHCHRRRSPDSGFVWLRLLERRSGFSSELPSFIAPSNNGSCSWPSHPPAPSTCCGGCNFQEFPKTGSPTHLELVSASGRQPKKYSSLLGEWGFEI